MHAAAGEGESIVSLGEAAHLGDDFEPPWHGKGVELDDEVVKLRGECVEFVGLRGAVAASLVESLHEFRKNAGDSGDDAVAESLLECAGERAIVAYDAAGRDVVAGEKAHGIQRSAGVFDADDVVALCDEVRGRLRKKAGAELRKVVEQNGGVESCSYAAAVCG